MIKVFHGKTKNALTSFLQANRIDEIFIPKIYRLKTPGAAFDPIPLIREQGSTYYQMEWNVNYNQTEQEHLITLFN